MSRVPVRVRLTLAFAAAMALILGTTGFIVHSSLASDLDRTVNDGLDARADDVAALIRRSGPNFSSPHPGRLVEGDEDFLQLIDAHGNRLGGEPPILGRPLLTPNERSQALKAPLIIGRREVPALANEGVRLHAEPLEVGGKRAILVVGTSLETRDEALSSLRHLFVIGGPIALVLVALGGYGLAAMSLRPVEAMRQRATVLSVHDSGGRLPVPPGRDELARLGGTLNEMLDRVEVSLERERAFIADASHQLRTPLAILRTEIELALKEKRSRAELESALASAAEETERLVRLSDDLLVLAHVDQKAAAPLRIGRVDATELLERTARRFAPLAKRSRRAIEVDTTSDAALPGDANWLAQALGNMLDNALRHSKTHVQLRALRENNLIELHVLDDGPGFATSILGHAFERFSRGDDARADSGAGLGLAVVAAIARAHNGSAHAANRVGGGADVWLALPLDAQPEHDDPSGRERSRALV